ncbi:MAG: hypothetical protein K5838_06905 [Elusimicrobiales bacterium]|nr:hypothetical protein [Elusimicrobiales bacterium]
MTPGDIIVITSLAAIVLLIIRSLIKKGSRCPYCCGVNANGEASSSCSACAACHSFRTKKIKANKQYLLK